MDTTGNLPIAIEDLLDRALSARMRWQEFLFSNEKHEPAFRLFNGFVEGCPDLVVDVYAATLVLFLNHANPGQARMLGERAARHLLGRLPWVRAVVEKIRNAPEERLRRGELLHGEPPDRKIRENGVFYAVDLMLNLDASLYLDTRNLRAWALENLVGRRVLNVFAYTGSLGVAALAGGARQVVQLDLNRRFLNLARESFALNGLPVHEADFIAGDFWSSVNRLKREGALFDCVFIDPPFFSQTRQGRVDLVSNAQKVINKVRPLVGHAGMLVAINNSLFLSGAEYLRQLQELCADGYLAVENLISVPPDFTGFPETRAGDFPRDPAPFNHPTKIAILRVQRKDERSASPA